MGNDHVDFMGETFTPGNNISMSVHPKTEAEASRLFNGLSEGGHVIVPMGQAPWGGFFGMFKDKFGIKWMINCMTE
jgi:PhnB protein